MAKAKPKEDPSLFDELVDVVGKDAAARLIELVGGQQVVVPAKATAELAEMIGEAAASRMCDEFAGIRVYVPTRATLDREERNTAILEAIARGERYADIARAHRVTVRTVFYVRRAGIEAGVA